MPFLQLFAAVLNDPRTDFDMRGDHLPLGLTPQRRVAPLTRRFNAGAARATPSAMKIHTAEIVVRTEQARQLVDITAEARAVVDRSGVREGLCSLYAQGATAALMVQENDDPNIATDVLGCLAELVPAGKWLHDRIDHNGAAHIQAGIVGPSETIPIRGGELGLSRWQNVFLCDFDGPRARRTVLVTIIGT